MINYHGNYKAVANLDKLINYIKKHGDFLTDLPTHDNQYPNINPMNQKEFSQHLLEYAEQHGIKKALNYFVETRPHEVLTKFKTLQSNLRNYFSFKSNLLYVTPEFLTTDFNYPQEILDWFEYEKFTKTLVLIGPSGFGKTEAMITLLQDFYPILIPEINELANLDEDSNAILFDDVNWEKFSREQLLKIVESKRPTSIRILYQSVLLRPKIVKVIIANVDPFPNMEIDPNLIGISRRIVKIFLKESLIKNKL